MPRTVFILGAGASVEFLPSFRDKPLTTQTLTGLLTDGFGEFSRARYNNFDIRPQLQELFFKVVGSLRKYLSDSHSQNFHFEHIIHLLDKYCSVYADKYTWTQLDKLNYFSQADLNLAFIDLVGGEMPLNMREAVLDLPIQLRNYILQYVSESHSIASNAPVLDILRAFFNSYRDAHQNISIYSLNYDNFMFEVSATEPLKAQLETGFDRNIAGNQLSSFDPIKVMMAADVFAPLHGCSFFAPTDPPEFECPMGFSPDAGEAAKRRSRTVRSLPKNQAGEKIYNTAMITGMDKFYALSVEPFATYYKRLIKDIDDADRIYVIGYGGADVHLNYLLRSKTHPSHGKQA